MHNSIIDEEGQKNRRQTKRTLQGLALMVVINIITWIFLGYFLMQTYHI
jgi:hypothetical protein